MAENRPPVWLPVLWFVAAALALAAVAIGYAKSNEVRWVPLGASVVLIVLGFTSLKRAGTP